MVLSYSYIFNIGQNEHRVKIYESYNRELGLHGEILFEFTSTRKDEVFKKLKKDKNIELTKTQWDTMKALAKEHCQHMVVLPDGSRYSY